MSSDFDPEPIKAKIAEAETSKVHTMLVIGGRDFEAGNISGRLHGKGNVGAKPKAEAIADILAAIKDCGVGEECPNNLQFSLKYNV